MSYRPKELGEDKPSGMVISKGVFAREVEVARIDNKSNHPTKDVFKFNSGFEPELCLQIHYLDGEYDGSVMTFGKYAKENDVIEDWQDFYNEVQRFLHLVHPTMEYIEDDFSISDKTLEAYKGRKFIVVKYQSDRKYYSERKGEDDYSMQTWTKVFAVGTDIESIKKQWSENVEYIKDYAPDIWDMKQDKKKEKDEGFNYGANKEEDKDII